MTSYLSKNSVISLLSKYEASEILSSDIEDTMTVLCTGIEAVFITVSVTVIISDEDAEALEIDDVSVIIAIEEARVLTVIISLESNLIIAVLKLCK